MRGDTGQDHLLKCTTQDPVTCFSEMKIAPSETLSQLGSVLDSLIFVVPSIF